MRVMLLLGVLAVSGCSTPNAERGTSEAPAGSAATGAPGVAAPARARAPASGAETSTPPITAGTVVPDPVKPFPAGLRGELLFQSDREGPTRLYVLDLSNGNVRRVGTTGDWFDEEPRWSNDGRRIAFGSTRGQKGNLDIFVMDADGSNVVRLTDHASAEQGPVWAADGKSVFFTGERDGRGEIYRVWLDTKRVDRVTSGIDRAIMPAASPDGRYLAYAAQTIMDFQLHLLDMTNGTTRQITSGGGACRPAFSPDSQEIAFVRMNEPSRLETVRETGPQTLFQDKKLWSYYPDYSPDGRFVAFSVSPEHHAGEDWDLAILDRKTPGQFTRLTSGRGNDRVPDWRPTSR